MCTIVSAPLADVLARAALFMALHAGLRCALLALKSCVAEMGDLHAEVMLSVVLPAATDILLGYHSEEGWTAAIHLLTGHYGLEVEVSFTAHCPAPAHDLSLTCSRQSDAGLAVP